MSQQLRVVPITHLTSALRVAELRLSIYNINSDFATMLSRRCLVPSPVASMKRGARSGRPALLLLPCAGGNTAGALAAGYTGPGSRGCDG